ncbi:exopolyphosphatase [Terriglobus roseus DSM 18391]|uniref:Exopolyphosphatase n=1 Tax=Terriglobus roseus (strain DSM 18391 / NRRL B-41598 / KBS 63) TaxID=926566 RepID=I3ZKK9_TERRK|nr:Ppx/GppA phosphatase family protein [Terriglobus roseus]AFL89777.1 exopolyphosphatase [Terriglobus roseus DSM 18391]
MPTFAAIDIGSNSCRLAIATVEQHKIKVFHEDREVVRLGESVFETGEISPDAMANTIRALKRFQKSVQAQPVDRVRVVATSAMRDARNASAFIAWVKSATGWVVEVISGLEEGRLIHLGVVTHEPGARGRCVLIDLGGGSCEVTLSDGGRIQSMVSMPLGSVRLQQEFLHSDPPTADQQSQLHSYIDREMRKLERKMGRPAAPLVIATSGAAAALAEASKHPSMLPKALAKAAKMVKKSTTTRRISTKIVPLETDIVSVRRLANKLVKMKNSERMAIPGIGPKRSEIIIGGAFVYADILERLNLKGFRYSPLGLRDGILAQMLSDADERASVHKAVEQERWEGVLEVCRRYNIDPKRADSVRADAVRLFDAMERVHGLPEDYRELLSAAAMMNEVGKFMNHQGHHRHTQYIIENSEIFGFSPAERTTMSAIARYLGKSRPDAMDRPMRSIPVEEHSNVGRAIVLLRLAVALNQNRANEALQVAVRTYPKRVLIELHAGRGGAELERWMLNKEAVYFREIFRRDLVVELA